MTDLRAAAQQALEALELAQTDVHWELNSPTRKFLRKAEKTLRAALAQQEAPVASAWIRDGVMVNAFPWPPGDPRGRDEDQYWQGKGYTASPLYTHPHRRETEQEPVAWASWRELARIKDFDSTIYANGDFDAAVPLYTAPPSREWEGLTDEDMEELLPLYSDPNSNEEMLEFAAAIEAKLKKKNA